MDFDAIQNKDYNNTFLFYFERKFIHGQVAKTELEWVYKNWHLSIYYSIIYIFAVFLGRQWMKRREKVHLYRSLIAWNILHSIFSVLGSFINLETNLICQRSWIQIKKRCFPFASNIHWSAVRKGIGLFNLPSQIRLWYNRRMDDFVCNC